MTGKPITSFTVARGDDFLQSVMQRMTRKNRRIALVLSGRGLPGRNNVAGVITRDEIAGTVMNDVST